MTQPFFKMNHGRHLCSNLILPPTTAFSATAELLLLIDFSSGLTFIDDGWRWVGFCRARYCCSRVLWFGVMSRWVLSVTYLMTLIVVCSVNKRNNIVLIH